MSCYRSRTDVFQQYRRSYRHVDKRLPEDVEPGTDGYMVLDVHSNVDQDDAWGVWISSLGKVRKEIHELEEKIRALEETLVQDQWPKIEFRVDVSNPSSPTALKSSDVDFFRASESIKSVLNTILLVFLRIKIISIVQRKVCLLVSGQDVRIEGGQLRQVKQNAQVSMNSKLTEAATRFRAYQTAYVGKMEKNNEFISQRVSKVPILQSPISIPQLRPAAEPNCNDPLSFVQDQLLVPKIDEQLRVEREEAIFKIAETVLELRDILEQMYALTIEQGSMADHISTNMHCVRDRVTKARTLVKERANNQDVRLRRKAILLALISGIIIAMLVISSK